MFLTTEFMPSLRRNSVSIDEGYDHEIDPISMYKFLDSVCATKFNSSTDCATLPRNFLRTFKRKQNDVEASADARTPFETALYEGRIQAKKAKNTFPEIDLLTSFNDRTKYSTNEPSKKKDHSVIIGSNHSLAYQLDCLSNDCFTHECQDKEGKITPLLPSVISNSSNSSNSSSDSNANTSQQVMNSRHLSSSNPISDDEVHQYGWFVDLTSDSIDSNEFVNNHSYQEYVTPTSNSLDTQVEWAQAADTVDDLLDDFF